MHGQRLVVNYASSEHGRKRYRTETYERKRRVLTRLAEVIVAGCKWPIKFVCREMGVGGTALRNWKRNAARKPRPSCPPLRPYPGDYLRPGPLGSHSDCGVCTWLRLGNIYFEGRDTGLLCSRQALVHPGACASSKGPGLSPLATTLSNLSASSVLDSARLV